MKTRRNPLPAEFVPLTPETIATPLMGCTDGQHQRFAYRMGGRAALLAMRLVGWEGDDTLTPIYRDLARDGDDAKLRRRLGAANRKLVTSGAAKRVVKRVVYEREVQAIVNAAYSFGWRDNVRQFVDWVTPFAGSPHAAALLVAQECYDPVGEQAWGSVREWSWSITHATLAGYGQVVAWTAERAAAQTTRGWPEQLDRWMTSPADTVDAYEAARRGQRIYQGEGLLVSAAYWALQCTPQESSIGYQRPAAEATAYTIMLAQKPDTASTAWFEKTESGEYGRRIAAAISEIPYPSAYDAIARTP